VVKHGGASSQVVSFLFTVIRKRHCPVMPGTKPGKSRFRDAGPESGSSFACISDSSFYLDRNDSIMDFFTGQKDAR
jgi:hypothetical protein